MEALLNTWTKTAMGLVLMGAGALLAGHWPALPAWASLLSGLGVLALLGGGGYLTAKPWLVFLWVSGVNELWGAGHTIVPHWSEALILALFATLVAMLTESRTSQQLGPIDGFLAVGLMVLLSTAFSILAPVPPPGPQNHALSVILVLYLATPPLEAATVLLILFHRRLFGDFIRRNYAWSPGMGRLIGQGFTIGISIIMVTAFLVWLESSLMRLPIQPNNPFAYSPHLVSAPLPAIGGLIVAVVILAPLAEEALFRGLLFGGIRARWGSTLATVLSAVIFGAAHMNVSLFLPLAVAGLLLAMLYGRSGSLWPSTVAHATLNGLSVLMALLIR